MISSQFSEFVSSVKDKLGKNVYENEATVSMMIVLPVLKHLGWPADNPSYVCPEYRLQGRKVDYGLKISEGKEEGLRCIIEVKAVGNIVEADRQLFEYAFHAGTPLAILTDGKLWRFYLPLAAGKYKERLVRTLDFEEHSIEELGEGLVRYVSFDNTRSGQAKKNAENDLDKRIAKDEAKKNISTAWENLLGGASDKLVNLLIEETSLISSAPERSDVEKFLKNFRNAERRQETPPEIKPRKKKKHWSEDPAERKKKNKKPSFFLLGREYRDEKNVTSAFVKIFEILAERDGTFLARLAPELAGRKNKRLSRNLTDLGDIGSKVAKRFPGGWWLSTHSSTDGKISILRKVCKVAEIPFGKPGGLKVDF